MAGHQCSIIHQLNPEARVDVKNDQLKAIKVALRLSRYPVHALMFEVGVYFRSLTTTKPIVEEAPMYLEHPCPAIRFKLLNDQVQSTTCIPEFNTAYTMVCRYLVQRMLM